MAQIMFFFLVQSISLLTKYTLNKNISTDEEKSEAETIFVGYTGYRVTHGTFFKPIQINIFA